MGRISEVQIRIKSNHLDLWPNQIKSTDDRNTYQIKQIKSLIFGGPTKSKHSLLIVLYLKKHVIIIKNDWMLLLQSGHTPYPYKCLP